MKPEAPKADVKILNKPVHARPAAERDPDGGEPGDGSCPPHRDT